jgi:penicillin-binding protein 1C
MTMEREGDSIPLRILQSTPEARGIDIGDASTWSLITNMLVDPHARAHSFGMHSVLQMPFDAAVKTGTSSDFRDTWTVGYTRDYTVGVWVGNFDGSAMRKISGVTGAGPLWNRIMLHLHERNEPARFESPRGYVQTPICATTGHAPTRSCEAVVTEWVLPRDLATVRQPIAPAFGHEYDPWLALHPTGTARSFRIVFPRDGDTFALNPTSNAAQARQQQLAFRSAGATGPVRWSVNGVTIQTDSEGTPFWPLHLGTWTIDAHSSRGQDRVIIHVVTARNTGHAGFTYLR